jgi:hypothetical protein
MNVIHAADPFQKILQVRSFGEPGELRNIIEADVHQSDQTGLPQRFEKLFRGLLGKPNGEHLHSGLFSLVSLKDPVW